jgi:hypothetical protein
MRKQAVLVGVVALLGLLGALFGSSREPPLSRDFKVRPVSHDISRGPIET